MVSCELSLTAADIEKLEKRAANAVNGYASDVNINTYVYGKDVTSLLNDRQCLLKECRRLEEAVEALKSDNARLAALIADDDGRVLRSEYQALENPDPQKTVEPSAINYGGKKSKK